MSAWMYRGARVLPLAVLLSGAGVLAPATAHADNKRLNSAVVSAVYTLQHQAGCTNDVIRDNALTLAAQWHADDMMNNRNI
ncbi:MAG: CAP domain-containing protein, partial [Mycobacterium sp.]